MTDVMNVMVDQYSTLTFGFNSMFDVESSMLDVRFDFYTYWAGGSFIGG